MRSLGKALDEQIMSTITHDGIVESIDGNLLKIRITQLSSCASCHVANQCSASRSKEKIVDIRLKEQRMENEEWISDIQYQIGEHVILKAHGYVGLRAVALAFVIPFMILVIVLFVAIGLTDNEPLSALLGLGSLSIYYIFLYLLRGRIGRKLQFSIEHKT